MNADGEGVHHRDTEDTEKSRRGGEYSHRYTGWRGWEGKELEKVSEGRGAEFSRRDAGAQRRVRRGVIHIDIQDGEDKK